MGWRGGGSEIGGRSKRAGARKVSPVDKSIWKKTVRENANKETMGSRDSVIYKSTVMGH